jgi:hypothetical protein
MIDRTQFSASITQAGSWDATPAAAHRSTSLAPPPGEGAAVVEPSLPDKFPAATDSDVISRRAPDHLLAIFTDASAWQQPGRNAYTSTQQTKEQR